MEFRRRAVAAALAIAATVSACAAPGGSETAPMTAPSLGNLRGSSRTPAITDLAGLKTDDVLSLLGQPDLRRDEAPAELWQYRAADCVLNLFFYDQSGSYRLAHAEAWQRSLIGGGVPARCHDENAPIKAHLISQSRL
jgi:hypothetical protein